MITILRYTLPPRSSKFCEAEVDNRLEGYRVGRGMRAPYTAHCVLRSALLSTTIRCQEDLAMIKAVYANAIKVSKAPITLSFDGKTSHSRIDCRGDCTLVLSAGYSAPRLPDKKADTGVVAVAHQLSLEMADARLHIVLQGRAIVRIHPEHSNISYSACIEYIDLSVKRNHRHHQLCPRKMHLANGFSPSSKSPSNLPASPLQLHLKMLPLPKLPRNMFPRPI